MLSCTPSPGVFAPLSGGYFLLPRVTWLFIKQEKAWIWLELQLIAALWQVLWAHFRRKFKENSWVERGGPSRRHANGWACTHTGAVPQKGSWQVPQGYAPRPMCQCCLIVRVRMLLSCTPLGGTMNVGMNSTIPRAVSRAVRSSTAEE